MKFRTISCRDSRLTYSQVPEVARPSLHLLSSIWCYDTRAVACQVRRSSKQTNTVTALFGQENVLRNESDHGFVVLSGRAVGHFQGTLLERHSSDQFAPVSLRHWHVNKPEWSWDQCRARIEHKLVIDLALGMESTQLSEIRNIPGCH